MIKTDRWFPSSKRCFDCGHIVLKLLLNIREWDCPQCGVSHDRDVNAALKILAALLAVSVSEANVRPNRDTSIGQLRNTRLATEAETQIVLFGNQECVHAGVDVNCPICQEFVEFFFGLAHSLL